MSKWTVLKLEAWFRSCFVAVSFFCMASNVFLWIRFYLQKKQNKTPGLKRKTRSQTGVLVLSTRLRIIGNFCFFWTIRGKHILCGGRIAITKSCPTMLYKLCEPLSQGFEQCCWSGLSSRTDRWINNEFLTASVFLTVELWEILPERVLGIVAGERVKYQAPKKWTACCAYYAFSTLHLVFRWICLPSWKWY